MNYWLLKSEPVTFSIDHLKEEGTTVWSGVRNYQARNFIRDGMKKGDLCLFYHSSAGADAIGIAGVGKVASDPYLDPTASDPKSEYYEPKKNIEWYVVDVKFVKKFKHLIGLKQLKIDPKLSGMLVIRPGSRLSVQPVSEKDFRYIAEKLAE